MIINEHSKLSFSFEKFYLILIKFIFILLLFTVILPFILLDYNYIHISGDFFNEITSLNISINNFYEVYLPVNKVFIYLAFIANNIFFLTIILFLFFLKKRNKLIYLEKNHLSKIFYLSTFFLILINIFNFNFTFQILNSLTIFFIISFNVSFFLVINFLKKKLLFLIYFFVFFFVAIIKGIIIDKSVFLSAIFFCFILFFSFNKKIIYNILFFLSIFFIIFFLSFLKRFTYDYVSSINNLNNQIQFFDQKKIECQKINLVMCLNQEDIEKSKNIVQSAINLLRINLDKSINTSFLALIVDKKNVKEIFIQNSFSNKYRNNLFDISNINNEYLKYFVYSVNETIKRFDLNYNLLRTFQIHNLFPDNYKFYSGETLKPIISKLLPRYIYPDKKIENLGNVFGRDYGYLASNDFSTTINVNVLVDGFINYGYPGLLIPIVLLFIYFTYIFYFTKNLKKYPFICLLLNFQIIFFLIIIESNISLIFGRLLYLNLLIILILLLTFLIEKKNNV